MSSCRTYSVARMKKWCSSLVARCSSLYAVADRQKYLWALPASLDQRMTGTCCIGGTGRVTGIDPGRIGLAVIRHGIHERLKNCLSSSLISSASVGSSVCSHPAKDGHIVRFSFNAIPSFFGECCLAAAGNSFALWARRGSRHSDRQNADTRHGPQ